MASISLFIGNLMYGNYFWFYFVYALISGFSVLNSIHIWLNDKKNGNKLETTMK
jgi:hypothetical protein